MSRWTDTAVVVAVVTAAVVGPAQAAEPADYGKYTEEALQELLDERAEITKKILVPMRDGVGLSTDVYRPKATGEAKVPVVFWRTPYDFNTLKRARLRYAVEAVTRGYAFVIQNERGRYFSEGEFEILGHPRTDGPDALSWIAAQDWSNGRIGTLGCSSSAEWQLALAATDHPAHAAMVPMAAGAGIGRVGEFREQGNWYTGGVPRNLFYPWLYQVDNPLRPQLPSGLGRETRAHVAQYNDLAADKPEVEWIDHIAHLPVSEIMSELDEPPATFERFIGRTPADPGWREGGLYRDDEPWGVPALWFNSWYDVSIGPNMALYRHLRETADDPEVRDNQYAVIGPNVHCRFLDYGPDDEVGKREMGDTTFDTVGTIFAWFDRWLKDDVAAWPAGTPRVRYYTMGANEWRSADRWPPEAARPARLYLASGGEANTLYGDGRLTFEPPDGDEPPDQYVYDPMIPVPTIGGGDCCNGGTVVPGAFDQRPIEMRQDVLVYTSEPLAAPLTVTGFVDAVLHVSSDAPDTDFAIKLVDVAPDGTAWIVDDTIHRARYRDGYNRPTPMEPGAIHEIDFTPMTTSITFQTGHRIRVEVTSSNFPKYVRNLNTGGPNETESDPRVARNAIHHSATHPSWVELPVVGGAARPGTAEPERRRRGGTAPR